MEHILRYIDTVNDWVGKFVGYWVYILTAIVIYTVFTRYFFSIQNLWAYETSQFFFGAYFVLAGGYVLYRRGHVNVDIVYTHLSPKKKAIIDLVTALFFFLFIGSMTWFGWKSGWQSFELKQSSETAWSPPLYPIKLIIPVGAFLLLIQGISKFIHDIFIITGRVSK